jgi:flagellin
MIRPTENSTFHIALSHLRNNQSFLDRALERLASGKRINRGSDDPAGLISATQLEAAIAALEAESGVIQRADSNANIADGYTSQLSSMMSELNGKVVAAANTAGMSDAEIAAHQSEIDSLVSSIQRFTNDALGSLDGFALPNGGNEELAAALQAASASVGTLASGGANSVTSGNFADAQHAVDDAMQAVTRTRGTIGAYQKYDLQSRYNSNQVTRESLLDAKSRILDTDYALETSNLVRAQTLTQAGISVLKLIQQNHSRVLDLLR